MCEPEMKEMTKRIIPCLDTTLDEQGRAVVVKGIEFENGADACLAASIFHYGTYTVGEIKDYLCEKGIKL